MRGGRSVRWRTTPAAMLEAVAQAKAVGAAGVAVALHQTGHRASPPTMSVGAMADGALDMRVLLKA
jgi:hypothetical protein